MKIFLRDGKIALDSGQYKDAVEKLSAAEESFPLLGDYAALYLAEAFHNLGDHRKALAVLRKMPGKYPQSSLIKKARTAEIREARESEDGDLLRTYESYVKDYPEDEEINLAYGLFLKQSGRAEKAALVLRDIYVGGGVFSGPALVALGSQDIKPDDLIERASNLMKRYEFKEAERDLRRALSMDDGKRREEILKALGLSLFKQREYKEAAAVYDSINDLYYKARCLYRAGDKEGFEAALHDLLANNDKRAGYLLVAAASDKLRERDFDAALEIYNEAQAKYPSETEDAMWGTGWTYYMSGDYKKASDIFSKMYSRYDDPKYLYWKARSIEEQGEDARVYYDILLKRENSFYGALAYARTNSKPASPSAFAGPVSIPAPDSRYRIERVDALLSLGMRNEAVAELVCYSNKTDNPQAMIYVISRLQELGEFKRAIGLATKIPYSVKLHRYWYPLAYWADVEKISGKYDLDPFIALSVMREESRFDADARSAVGARGLMQLMPQTAYHLDKSIKLGISRESQITDVKNNIHLGAYYLKSLFREFKSLAHVLAAYNAGEIAVRKWEQQGKYRSADEFIEDIPYAETRNYVKKVMNSYFQYRKAFVSDKAAGDFSLLLGGI